MKSPAAEFLGLGLFPRVRRCGRRLSFGQSVQVGRQQPMVMEVRIELIGAAISWNSIQLCLLLGAMSVVRRKAA